VKALLISASSALLSIPRVTDELTVGVLEAALLPEHPSDHVSANQHFDYSWRSEFKGRMMRAMSWIFTLL